jgi:nucleoid-associated protein YgaU
VFYINVPAAAPTFTGPASNQTVMAGTAFSFTEPGATDANGAGISYSASGLPSWMQFNASTLTFSGTPNATGSFTISYSATADGVSSTHTFTVTANAPAAPTYSGPTSVAMTDVSTTAGASQTYANVFHGTNLSYQVSIPSSLNGFTASVDANGSMYLHAPVVTWPPKTGTVTIVGTDLLGRQVVANISVEVYPSSGAGGPGGAATFKPMMAAAASASTLSPTPNVQVNWFTYDGDGRVLVADGALQNGQIAITSASNSATNAYDAAGDLVTYTTKTSAGQYQTQKNAYNSLGQLTLVQTEQPGGSTYSPYETRNYDADGRLSSDVFYNLLGHVGAGTYNGSTVSFSDAGWVSSDTFYTYNADGELVDQSQYAEEAAQSLINQYGTGVATSAYATADATPPSAASGGTAGALYLATEYNYAAAGPGYGYDADGNVLGYRITTGSTPTVLNATPSNSTNGYLNTYIKQNNLLQANTTLVPITGSASQSTTNANTYNNLGELASSTGIVNGASQSQVMAYTSGGQLLQKSSTSNGSTTTTVYESVNENELASVDTAGTINVLSTTGGYSNSSTGTQTYTVRTGDTLQGLAQAIYGDSNYYYILAQANGLAPTATLTAGMMLKIPQVTTSTNAASTYQPYSQGTLLSGGASAFYTTAQILAMSIEAVLNQQSAIAQTVAKIEKQEQEAALEQQQAEQAQELVAQQSEQLALAKQAAQEAQQQAAKTQATAMAAQQAAQKAQQALIAKQQAEVNAYLTILHNRQMVEGYTMGYSEGIDGGINGFNILDDLNPLESLGPETAYGNTETYDQKLGDMTSAGAQFDHTDVGFQQQFYTSLLNVITSSGGIFNYMSSDNSSASSQGNWPSSLTSIFDLAVASGGDGGFFSGAGATDGSSPSAAGAASDGLSAVNKFFEGPLSFYDGGPSGYDVLATQYSFDQSQYATLNADAYQSQSVLDEANANQQQAQTDYLAASDQLQQDNAATQQASAQVAQLGSQLSQEESSDGLLAGNELNGNGGDLYIGNSAAQSLVSQQTAAGSATAWAGGGNDNSLASYLNGFKSLSDSPTLADLTNNVTVSSSILLGNTESSGSAGNGTGGNNAPADQGQADDPLLRNAQAYAGQGGGIYQDLNAIGAVPVSFALGGHTPNDASTWSISLDDTSLSSTNPIFDGSGRSLLDPNAPPPTGAIVATSDPLEVSAYNYRQDHAAWNGLGESGTNSAAADHEVGSILNAANTATDAIAHFIANNPITSAIISSALMGSEVISTAGESGSASVTYSGLPGSTNKSTNPSLSVSGDQHLLSADTGNFLDYGNSNYQFNGKLGSLALFQNNGSASGWLGFSQTNNSFYQLGAAGQVNLGVTWAQYSSPNTPYGSLSLSESSYLQLNANAGGQWDFSKETGQVGVNANYMVVFSATTATYTSPNFTFPDGSTMNVGTSASLLKGAAGFNLGYNLKVAPDGGFSWSGSAGLADIFGLKVAPQVNYNAAPYITSGSPPPPSDPYIIYHADL